MIALAMLWRVHARDCCFSTSMPLMVENLPGYLDIFASGMLTAWTFVHVGHRLRAQRVRWAMPLLGIAGFVSLGFLLIHLYDGRLAAQWQLAPQIVSRPLYGMAFAAIALGFLTSPPLAKLAIDNPLLRFCGVISYNLYLYHQMLARELLDHHLPQYAGDPHFDTVWQWRYTLLAFIVTIVEAIAATYLIERPLLRLPQPRLVRRVDGH